jgi:acetylornithine/succinyldiaminopimelate/putrescine aminotransferase
MRPRHPLADTYEQILREQLPNLFRLYLNPYVAQACFCLERYAQTTWGQRAGDSSQYQTFLANGFDEALSGSIKLARYSASLAGRPTTGLIFDPYDRLGPFAAASVAGNGKVVFLPGLELIGKHSDGESIAASESRFGFVVVVVGTDGALDRHKEAIRRVVERDAPLMIACVNRACLAALRHTSACVERELNPDIVVFDESFVNHEVPFGAFTARKALYDHWNRPGKTTFHSTTYQPNTISSLHFMKCLMRQDAEFHANLALDLSRIENDLAYRAAQFRRLYSPSLYKAIRATGFETKDVRASGAFVTLNGRKIFDGVSGVACSIRGHNPSTYAEEMEGLGSLEECRAEVAQRLRDLTDLDCVLPAVSGATAVENALKIALIAQFPRRHVLALKSGFGGKTLFSLTGTWNSTYKENIHPLYGDVVYVDPFAADARAQIATALAKDPVAVVQVELIQGVGGVRRVPQEVIHYLEARRRDAGYLLLVDEVQTGMYRTGPFTLSRAMGLTPDLLVVGKGASDMMFPFALMLYSAEVKARLDRAGSDLPAAIGERYGYEFGYKTVLNVLRRAEKMHLAERVAESGALFERLLGEGLAGCKAVLEVRVYGMLLGIELDATRRPRRWFRKRLFWFYLYNMLRHPRYPVLVGFCQYEPNVLKITPPLTSDPAEIQQVCATISDVLRRPFYRLAAGVLGSVMKSIRVRRQKHEHANVAAHEPGQH